jgi:branched-chain amino acid aminotransferase
VRVEERKISLDEIESAHRHGLLTDAFGTGTAASIAPISHIGYKGKMMELPPVAERAWCNRLKKELSEIKSGRMPDPFGWVVRVKSKLVVEELEEHRD